METLMIFISPDLIRPAMCGIWGTWPGGRLTSQIMDKWRVSWTLQGYFGGWVFPLHKPYPYSLYRWGFLHFRYLKCLVTKYTHGWYGTVAYEKNHWLGNLCLVGWFDDCSLIVSTNLILRVQKKWMFVFPLKGITRSWGLYWKHLPGSSEWPIWEF